MNFADHTTWKTDIVDTQRMCVTDLNQYISWFIYPNITYVTSIKLMYNFNLKLAEQKLEYGY